MNPSFFLVGHRRKILLLIITVGGFFIGLVMVTEGGLYIFQLFDYYACSGMTLLLFSILHRRTPTRGTIPGTRSKA
ncbi:sodium- and chloride-dependent GABA transporter 2-like [Salmo trutta]|uniref:sodium- and chloride-dependent GABA transporter 2-like n=1 Tax=Salmo trutta TaxID=8032 RepID=UPI00113103F9|nr:sodium- and chloride-dependent GABA transporter 2-like [Salmo trutta]